MNITNDHNLPSLIVDALTTDTYSKGNSNRSVTQLIDAPRIGVLFTEHEDSIDKGSDPGAGAIYDAGNSGASEDE